MGIRFCCPVCDKPLKVSATRAARLGKCPNCRHVVSAVAAESRRAETQTNIDHKTPQSESSFNGYGQAEGAADVCVLTDRPDTQLRSSALPTPLRENPDAQWFVHAPEGGHYGPASNELMYAWIVEGRVGPQSLVWRDDWKDWLPAPRVFPDITSQRHDAKSITEPVEVKLSRYLEDKQRGFRPSAMTYLLLLAMLAALLATAGLMLLPVPG